MDEKAMIEKIVEVFKDKTMEYNKKLNTEGYNTETYYIKNDQKKGYNYIDAVLEFKDFFLKMEYKVRTSMLLPASTLEMRIVFKGGKFPLEYSIYDLLNIIDETNFNCYTIPYIASIETMEKAIDYLFDAFVKYKDRIEELFHNEVEFKKLEENLESQIIKLVGANIFKSVNIEYIASMLEVYYILDAARFTTEIYANCVLTGKYKVAVKEYNKSKHKLTLYEERLKKYISTLKTQTTFLPEELETIDVAKKYQKVGFKQMLLTCLSFLGLLSVWSVFYGLIYAFVHFQIRYSSIYTTNSEYPIVIILGFITTFVNMYFIRKAIAKVVHKERYEEYILLDMLQNSSRANSLMTKLFQFVIACCIMTSILAANTYIKFTDKNIVLNDEYFKLNSEHITYDQVDSVYRTKRIITDFGYEIENNNYVIVLKDNTKIALFLYMTTDEVEEKVIPILKEKEITVKEVDVIDNIPEVQID